MPKLDYGTSGHKGLSYSRRGTLHTCARKFQIENSFGLKQRTESVTFSFGHAVAAGVQSYFEHGNLQQAVIDCTLLYSMPWDDLGSPSEARGKKNIWYSIHAVENYIKQIESLLVGELAPLKDWEIARLDGSDKAATEIQFRIELENGYMYEGHIDLILRNKLTGEYAILELKTTVFREPHDAMYSNSDQALSYSIVLDHAVGHQNTSYKVFYLIYSSSLQQWILKTFTKQAKQRLDWINNLIRDTEMIDYYEVSAKDGIPYPTNGASCYNFFRPCEYYNVCEMEDESLKLIFRGIDDSSSFEIEDNTDFVFSIDEIINSQIAKVQHTTGIELTPTAGDNNGQLIEV